MTKIPGKTQRVLSALQWKMGFEFGFSAFRHFRGVLGWVLVVSKFTISMGDDDSGFWTINTFPNLITINNISIKINPKTAPTM